MSDSTTRRTATPSVHWPLPAPPLVFLALAALLAGPVTLAAEPADAQHAGGLGDSPELEDRLSALEPFLGTWELDTSWANGPALWSKAEYRPAVGGQFVEVETWVRDGGGPVYLRYHSFLGIDADGAVTAHSFNHDGTTKSVAYEMPERGVLVSEWSMGEMTVRERLEPTGEDTARWRVWMRPAASADGEWMPALDGTWRRMEDPPVTSISADQFVASGPGVRQIERRRTLGAPAAEVYAAFTDADAFKKAYGPDSESLAANIELAIGGRYEWLFDGVIGSNGCQVLSYLPGRMLSFTWNAPPVQAANRDKRTWVVVDFEPTTGADGEPHTEVILTHLGFGEGAEWDETLAYFENAWDFVLSTFEKNLAR